MMNFPLTLHRANEVKIVSDLLVFKVNTLLNDIDIK